MLKHSMLYPRNTKSRRAVSMDGMWKFCLDPKGIGEGENYRNGLPGKERIPVPASFQDFYTEKDIREYTGDFWYEKEIFVPGEWNGYRIFVRFGAAAHRAAVYVNGEKITEHEGGFLPFCADVTESVLYNEYNKVVVKVNNELTVTNIPCGETAVLPNGKKISRPYFDFFNYAGLQRSVYLLRIPNESIVDFDLDYEISGEKAIIRYAVKTTGKYPVSLALFDEAGWEVSRAEGKEGSMEVEHAHFWEAGHAYLYRLRIQITDRNRILDEYEQEIGIRTVQIQGTSMLLNGKPVYLKGFGKHEDSDIVGRGFHIGVMKRDFELMKWIGANSFRTSHYPYSEEIYQMADREGFLVIDEAAAAGMSGGGMNFMEASPEKKGVFFEKETTPQLLKAHKAALEEMIARDKNHPCVIAWSLFHEPETTNRAAVPYFEEIFELAHSLDMQKRPRTFAMAADSKPSACHCYGFSDFISLNRYYGWHLKGGHEILEAMMLFRKEMEEWKALDLNKPFIFTEYGADALENAHKLPSVMWSQEYQEEYFMMANQVLDAYDFIKGEQVWNFADFQTIEGFLWAGGSKKGIFTRARQPKDAAYLLRRRWKELPLDFKNKLVTFKIS